MPIDAGSTSNILRAIESLAQAKNQRRNSLMAGLQTGTSAVVDALKRRGAMDWQTEQSELARQHSDAQAEKARTHTEEMIEKRNLLGMQRDFVSADATYARQKDMEELRQAYAREEADRQRGLKADEEFKANLAQWGMLDDAELTGGIWPGAPKAPAGGPPGVGTFPGGFVPEVDPRGFMKPPSQHEAITAIERQAEMRRLEKEQTVSRLLQPRPDKASPNGYRPPTWEEFGEAYSGHFGATPAREDVEAFNASVAEYWGRVTKEAQGKTAAAVTEPVDTRLGTVDATTEQGRQAISAEAEANVMRLYPELAKAKGYKPLSGRITDEMDRVKYKEAVDFLNGYSRTTGEMATQGKGPKAGAEEMKNLHLQTIQELESKYPAQEDNSVVFGRDRSLSHSDFLPSLPSSSIVSPTQPSVNSSSDGATKVVGGKTWVRRNGSWVPQE